MKNRIGSDFSQSCLYSLTHTYKFKRTFPTLRSPCTIMNIANQVFHSLQQIKYVLIKTAKGFVLYDREFACT